MLGLDAESSARSYEREAAANGQCWLDAVRMTYDHSSCVKPDKIRLRLSLRQALAHDDEVVVNMLPDLAALFNFVVSDRDIRLLHDDNSQHLLAKACEILRACNFGFCIAL